MNKYDWLILIIEKEERKILINHLAKEKVLPNNFVWIIKDLGKFDLMKFTGKEELITKLSFCLSSYKDTRKYIGTLIQIDKTGEF